MNLACANNECRAELKYLRGGRLFLMDRTPQLGPTSKLNSWTVQEPEHHVAMKRYFWLCENCAEQFTIRSWTESGIELVPRHMHKQARNVSSQHSREMFLPGLVG